MDYKKIYGLVYGQNVVYEVLKGGKREIKKIYLAGNIKSDIKEKIAKIVRHKNILAEITTREILDKITRGGLHQGVAAEVSEISVYSIEEAINFANESKESPFFLILNNINDPQNTGALLRVAEACKVHGMIISSHNNPTINSTVVKTSAGASEYVPIIMENNIAQTIDKLKKSGVWIFGAHMDGDTDYYNADFNLPLALVVGNEGEGLQHLVRAKCDFLLKIPMLGKINSLNVSVAGALLMFEILRKRNKI
ncbi:23S rRNA (guanosine(2251)-2'-O)-methyltransferase RlmB [Candidatus Desantisbacteria bacterium]|nr:23S rRNA (guanosine(2251)-2'-O)-methyltransferase RlmB [Candidatus Desantisbacteria bacterium]